MNKDKYRSCPLCNGSYVELGRHFEHEHPVEFKVAMLIYEN